MIIDFNVIFVDGFIQWILWILVHIHLLAWSHYLTFYKYFVFLKEPITSENTRLVAKKIHAHHSIECSAKTGENIDKLFEMAGRAAMAHRRRRHTSRVSKWPFSHCNVLWSNYLQPHHKISQYLVMDRIYIIVSEIAFSSTKNWIYLCARLFQNLKSSF